MRQRLLLGLFCALVAYLALFYQLGALPYFGSDEPRYARIGEEMAQGGDFIIPHLEGRPWMEKAPLLFWMEALSFDLFGVSEWVARLPNALLALLGALMTAAFAWEVRGPRAGLLAFLILLTSGMFVMFGRVATTDLALAVGFSGAALAGFHSLRSGSRLWAAAAGASLAAAVLAKGPVAVVLLGAVFAAYLVLTAREFWSGQQLLIGFGTFLALAVPWFVLAGRAQGHDFVMTFWVNHHLARFATDLHHHAKPVWFYLPVLLVGFFPWTFFLFSAGKRAWKLRSRLTDANLRVDLFLWLWALVPLAFFTASSSKLPGYILPVFPAVALLVALEWDRFLGGDLVAYSSMKAALAATFALALILAVGLVCGFEFIYRSAWVGVGAALPLVAGVFWGNYEYRRARYEAVFTVLTSAMTLTLALLYWQASPVIAVHHSARDLAIAAAPLISEQEPLILYRYFHHSARYYAGFQTTSSALEGMEQLSRYARAHRQPFYLLLTQRDGWEELQQGASAQLVRHEGNLYLVRIDTPPATWRQESGEPGPHPTAEVVPPSPA